MVFICFSQNYSLLFTCRPLSPPSSRFCLSPLLPPSLPPFLPRPPSLFHPLVNIKKKLRHKSCVSHHIENRRSKSASSKRSESKKLAAVFCTGEFLNDLFQFDIYSMAWTELTNLVVGAAPTARCCHGMTFSNDTLFVFAGYGVAGTFVCSCCCLIESLFYVHTQV